MIRIVIENILLFLLPTMIYLAYALVAQGENRSPSRAVNEAPLIVLFVAGVAIVIIALFTFTQSNGGKPGQHYEPPVFKDGRIEPGRIN